MTDTLSHEASESATDPRPGSRPGWRSGDTGLEIADLCEPFSAAVAATVPEGDGGAQNITYRVSRNYSNMAALLGNEDPCKPVNSTVPYYGVALDPLVISVGRDENNDGEVIVKIKPYAYGDVGQIAWQIGQLGGGITITPDHGLNRPGDTVGVRIHVDSSTPSSVQQLYVIGHAQAGSHSVWVSDLLY